MSRRVITPQTIAHSFSHLVFYLPRGFIKPILSRYDTTRELVAHHRVACAFCSRKLAPQRNVRSKVTRDSQIKLERLQNKFARLAQKFINFSLFVLYKLIRKSWFDKLGKRYEKMGEAILPKLKKIADFFLHNQTEIVWYGFLPALALLGCAWIYGLGIIPEIYALLIASFWGGKILNHMANLVVHQHRSNEWATIVRIAKRLIGKEDTALSNPTKKEAIKLVKRFLIEMTLINILQKFPEFVGYCFQAFFSWLAFYVLVKTATHEAPMMIHKLEQRMKNSYPEPLHWYHQVDNLLWLGSYQAFMMTGQDYSIKKYRKLHETAHHKSDLQRKSVSVRHSR